MNIIDFCNKHNLKLIRVNSDTSKRYVASIEGARLAPPSSGLVAGVFAREGATQREAYNKLALLISGKPIYLVCSREDYSPILVPMLELIPVVQKEKVYISGKITGLPTEEAERNFQKAEDMLRALGYDVINPMKLPHNHDKSWISCMREDVATMVREANYIYQQDNWQDSEGSIDEKQIADIMGIPVLVPELVDEQRV